MKVVTKFVGSLGLVAILFNGCGSSGSDDNDSGDTGNSASTSTTVTAVDGYIKNAIVKDSVGNIAIYDKAGKYIFSSSPVYPITLTGGQLLDTNKSFDLNMSVSDGSSLVISPITTFLGNNSDLLSKFANLGLNKSTLSDFSIDYMDTNDLNLAKLSQLLYVILRDSNLTADFKASLESNTSIDSMDKLFDLATHSMTNSGLDSAQRNCGNGLLSSIKGFTGDISGIEKYLDANKSNYTQGCANSAPVAINGSIDGAGASSKTFSMTDVISDYEDAGIVGVTEWI